MSREQIATQVGVSRSAIARYETGHQIPSYQIAVKLFELLFEKCFEFQSELHQIMSPSVKTIPPFGTCIEALNIMKRFNYSYLPVKQGKSVVGTVSDKDIIHIIGDLNDQDQFKQRSVETIMSPSLPIFNKQVKIREVIPLVIRYNAILVSELGELVGIITKADLLMG